MFELTDQEAAIVNDYRAMSDDFQAITRVAAKLNAKASQILRPAGQDRLPVAHNTRRGSR